MQPKHQFTDAVEPVVSSGETLRDPSVPGALLTELPERGAGSSVDRTLGSKSSSCIDPSTRMTVLMPVSASREIDLIAVLEELPGLAGSRRSGAIGWAVAGCVAAMATAAAGAR